MWDTERGCMDMKTGFVQKPGFIMQEAVPAVPDITFKVRYSSRNNVYLIYKNMPLLQIIWNFPLLLLGFSCKALFFATKGFGREYLAGIKNGILYRRSIRIKK